MNAIDNVYKISFLVGFVLLTNGGIRHMIYLQDFPAQDDKKGMLDNKVAFFWVATSIASVIEFSWWYPIFAYAVSFIISILFSKVYISFDTPKFNSVSINIGIFISVAALIGNITGPKIMY